MQTNQKLGKAMYMIDISVFDPVGEQSGTSVEINVLSVLPYSPERLCCFPHMPSQSCHGPTPLDERYL